MEGEGRGVDGLRVGTVRASQGTGPEQVKKCYSPNARRWAVSANN